MNGQAAQPISSTSNQTAAEIIKCGAGRMLSPLAKWDDESDCDQELSLIIERALSKERERCAQIAELVNVSIRDIGKFAAAILNPQTCIVPGYGLLY